MSFDAESLVILAMNERPVHESVTWHIDRLRYAIDRLAEQAAKSNAEWHDDPESDDHAEYHAPAIEQYPRAVRDEAILDLVRHYLTEATLSGR